MIGFKKYINKKNIVSASVFFSILFLTASLLFYFLNISTNKTANTKKHTLHDTVLKTTAFQTIPGIKFVTAVIKPIEFEINNRFWGWRPNDLIEFTDNINNFQLGVLEVTRRSVVALAERISRTGSTASFDKSLGDAINWFMVKSDSFWFPSAESKYKTGIKNLNDYIKRLSISDASFYTRTDNLIPLLSSYEDLLGSCDEDLIKQKKDGDSSNFFIADNYFYYAKGVTSSLYTILQAIQIDFKETLNSRHGAKLLAHAIESCHTASNINPWIITDSKLDGILANHRANIAAPVSHARFYIGALIKTLST